MGLFNWIGIGSDESTANNDKRTQEASQKIMSQQNQVLDSLRKINRDLGRAKDVRDARMRNAERLIKEGGGL